MLRICLLLLTLAGGAASAETYSGTIRIVDADTLWAGGTKIRLHGIDAQEMAQTCELADGRAWACGQWATDQARALYEGAFAICDRAGPNSYDRVVARCRVDGQDIAMRLVRDGVAEAAPKYSLDYVDAEKAAWFEGLGIWRGRVQSPADFRAGVNTVALRPAEAECTIKGNISENGQIYHLPGQRFYAATRISNLRGERWFCTEAEALAAGWRPALR